MRELLLCGALAMCACRPEPRQRDDSTVLVEQSRETPVSAAAPAAALPSVSVASNEPAAALTRYLAYASYRGAPSGVDSLSDCPPFDSSAGGVEEGWEPDDYVGLVLPRVLGASMNKADATGRSATGRAEVVRVAEIQRDAGGWAGTLERRLDTLTFALQRGTSGWAVCGPATKARSDSLPGEMTFIITHESALRTEVNDAHWLPAGTTWEMVASHADSVVRAGR